MPAKRPRRAARSRSTKQSLARLTPLGWAISAVSAASFVAAYGTGREQLLLVGGLLALLVVIAWLIVRFRRVRLVAHRSFSPHVIQAGGVTTVSLEVRNVGLSRTPIATWRDLVPWRPFATPDRELASLAPRGPRAALAARTTIRYGVRPPRRGIHSIGPLSLDYRDPFGLVAGHAVLGEAAELTVVPAVSALPESGVSIEGGDGTARIVQRQATGNDDDLMTREYRRGDALRRVHWRASARHGELMVRQEEQRSFPEARIVFDSRRSGYRDVSSEPDDEVESESFEWVVRMVASLGVRLHTDGFHVSIGETGDATVRPIEAGYGGAGTEDFLTSLATVALSHAARSTPVQSAIDGASGPVFAVLAEPDSSSLDWIVRQRRPFELAVAFVLASSPTPALDAVEDELGIARQGSPIAEFLQQSGWTVVPVSIIDDPATAWARVMAGTVIVHGRA